MSEVTGQDLAHAALRRLSASEGTGAGQALLERLGIASVTSIPESAIDEILAACPEAKPGEGVMVGAGGKLSTKDTLDAMALDRNAGDKSNGIADAMKEVIEGAPTLQDGLNNAARAIHVRNRAKATTK